MSIKLLLFSKGKFLDIFDFPFSKNRCDPTDWDGPLLQAGLDPKLKQQGLSPPREKAQPIFVRNHEARPLHTL